MIGYRSFLPWYSVGEQVDRAARGLRQAFVGSQAGVESMLPAFNIYSNADGAVLVAELPGVDIKDIELTVTGATVAIKGVRKVLDGDAEGSRFIRRERLGGEFSRSFEFPFHIDAARAEATSRKGILRIDLPRAKSDKPKRIAVQAAS